MINKIIQFLASCHLSHKQCAQIGLFWKGLGNKFPYKISLTIKKLYGLFWKNQFLVKTAVATTYLATFGKNLTSFFQHLVALASRITVGIGIITF